MGCTESKPSEYVIRVAAQKYVELDRTCSIIGKSISSTRTELSLSFTDDNIYYICSTSWADFHEDEILAINRYLEIKQKLK